MSEQQPQQQSKASSAKELVLGLVVLAVLAAGAVWGLTAWLGGDNDADGSSEHTEAETAYIDHVTEAAGEAGSGLPGLGDDHMLELGHAVCDDIADGMAPAEVARSIENTDGPFAPYEDVAADVVGAAELYLCDG